jgi:anthranilate/para-aminobenzoate synthase component I
MLRARELPLAPDALALARRLGDEPELALLWSASGSGPSFIAVRPLCVSEALDPEPELATRSHERQLASAPRWIGLLPYEALRGIERPAFVPAVDGRPEPHVSAPAWWRLGAVVCVGARVTVIGDDEASVDALCERLMTAREGAADAVHIEEVTTEPVERHGERVRAALELIRQGQIYQINLARRLDLQVRGDAIDVLQHLCRDTRPPYAAAFRFGASSVLCTSPELVLEQRANGQILTSPIKGTRPRGADARSDARLRAELDADPKERAELSMIIDVERNDVGRVSTIGSVRASEPSVSTHGLVWHRRAHVSGVLAPGVSRARLLRAMLPSGSVTGAPKVRAMELIASLEAARRGLYTGALGFITHAGEMTLAMAIRTLTTRGVEGHYFSGGGIVVDSDPEREIEETRWKAQQLFGRAASRGAP